MRGWSRKCGLKIVQFWQLCLEKGFVQFCGEKMEYNPAIVSWKLSNSVKNCTILTIASWKGWVALSAIPPSSNDEDELWTIRPMKEMSYGVSGWSVVHKVCVKPSEPFPTASTPYSLYKSSKANSVKVSHWSWFTEEQDTRVKRPEILERSSSSSIAGRIEDLNKSRGNSHLSSDSW